MRRRSGFTLVELLVAIVVIGILASLVIGALARATETAKIARTRSIVAKLHDKVMQRWESYRTRRLPIAANLNQTQTQVAQSRLTALRELMRLEMPQRWEDVTSDMSAYPSAPAAVRGILPAVPSLSWAYLNRFNRCPVGQPTALYDGAECLYLIVTMGAEDDSLGKDHINPKDIGDKDGDGMPEFHDGWGNPISFLRWAPGFTSAVAASELQIPNATDHHDPFDPRRLDGAAWRMTPLVYSGGADQTQDIWVAAHANDPTNPDPAELNNPNFFPTSGYPSGMPMNATTPPPPDNGDNAWTDNIHNHLISIR